MKNRLGDFGTGHPMAPVSSLEDAAVLGYGGGGATALPTDNDLLFLTASAYFVCSGEAGPWLVCPSVIVLGVCHLHIVTETNKDLPLPEFFHRGSLAELQGGRKVGPSQRRTLDHGSMHRLVDVENEPRKTSDVLDSKMERGSEPCVPSSGILGVFIVSFNYPTACLS